MGGLVGGLMGGWVGEARSEDDVESGRFDLVSGAEKRWKEVRGERMDTEEGSGTDS